MRAYTQVSLTASECSVERRTGTWGRGKRPLVQPHENTIFNKASLVPTGSAASDQALSLFFASYAFILSMMS